MSKINFKVILLTLALCFMFAGCGKEKSPVQSDLVKESEMDDEQTVTPPPKTQETEDNTDGMPVPDKKAAAREAYMDFLNGKGVVTTSDMFKWDDENYNYCTPVYGTYSYQELKYAIAEETMGDGTAKYAFFDVGENGANLMALRFENENGSFNNWTGIICYDGESLKLTYSFEDGCRTIGELFTSGCLRTGGSDGAGAQGEDVFLFTEDGTATRLYESHEYWGSYAGYLHYQLEEPHNTSFDDKYFDLSPMFYVKTYSDENGLKVYVEYSSDADMDASNNLEKSFVEELTDRGVKLVDEDEINRLFDTSGKDFTKQVTWTDYDDGLLPYFNAEVSACYPEDWWYNFYKEYEEVVLDSTEYAVSVAVMTTKPVTDFKVVSLNITDYSDNGLVCSTTELFSLPELTPDKPLLITLSFPGDLPSYGVRFVDVFGSQRLFTFCQSGMDGSLIFEEAKLENEKQTAEN